ncbi:bifunctional DNA primase/polymerase [Duganella fentianensis]|uniref:bifunctional DNA primase/polymerase n=1 Tax=Duganella fentianensis TaxID=2692177 RepID=UPI0032B1C6F6
MIADSITPDVLVHNTNLMRAIALAYAKRGWSILPINGITNGACDCGHEHPASHNGAHPCSYFTHMTASCDPAIIIGWFDKWPNMNFAVAPGYVHDGVERIMVIVEVPANHDRGEQVMVQFAEMVKGQLNVCGKVVTPDGKYHFYVEVDAKHDLNFGKIDGAKIYAKDCHVMAAGSLHHSGIAYLWDGDPLPTIPVIAGSASINAKSDLSASTGPASTSPAFNGAETQQPIESDIAVTIEEDAVQSEFAVIAQATTMRIEVNRALAAQYMDAGFKLCRIATGSKGPKCKDWPNKPISLNQVNHEGLGLIHALSGTCAIDLDNFDSAVAWFETRGIDLHALFAADDAVQIKSGRPNRGKLLYRLPQAIGLLPTFQIKNHNASMLVEFRCAPADVNGTGIQDVLPPTIHPDTDKAYEWGGAGDFKNLPELPADVCALWQSLLTTKTAMKPLHAPAAAKAGYSIVEGGRNNALFKLGGNAARIGMSQEHIRAVLLIENQKRCQPPLPDHEVESIAKSAATNSYGAKEAARSMHTGEPSVEALELANKAVKEETEQTSNAENVAVSELPAVMRDIADWNARTSRTIQPAFALCTALAACASVLARDFVGAGGSYTNLYITAVGPTASGKENALDTVSNIIDVYDWTRRAGKPASNSGVLTVMIRNPASTFLIDELGEVLQGVFDPNAASHQAQIGTVLMELYTKGGKNYRGTEYAQQEAKSGGRPRGDVFSPCPSIFGATTATTLYKGLNYEAIHSGFLPRILVFRAPDQIPMPNIRCEQMAMPESVVNWMNAIKDRVEAHAKEMQKHSDLTGKAANQYMPIGVPFSPAAQALYQQAMIDMVIRRNASNDELESNMLSRLVENSCRVALTLALATDPLATEVDAEHWKLALTIVTQATDAFMADLRANLFDSKHAKVEALAYKQIVRFFKDQGRPISERGLVDRCKPYGAAAPKEREQAIKALEAQGKITKQPGRNTNTVLYLPRG